MDALIKIFSGPVDLLDKARRDHAALKRALGDKDLEAVRDAVFNFSVSTYHLIDWVSKYQPELKPKISSLRENPSMKIVRDICNASKHVELDEQSKAYKDYPASTTSMETSSTSSVVLSGMSDVAGTPSWTLKVVTKQQERLRFEDVASEAMKAVEKFFKENVVENFT